MNPSFRCPAARSLFAACVLATAGTAWAQNLKPGLWEITGKTTSSDGQMEKAMAQAQAQMASMPPAQRKMIEDMMAKQGVGLAPGAGNTVRICMTPEMVAQGSVPNQTQGDCKTSTSPRGGSTLQVKFSCSNPSSTGEGTVTLLGPEAYTSKMSVTTTAAGAPQKMNIDSSGKWLAADCGAIKPLPVTPAKK